MSSRLLQPISSNGVSMTARRMNMSDSYMWIFSFAGQLLIMLNPVLCSYLMELNMENFVYMAISCTALGLIFIPIMTKTFNHIRANNDLKVWLNNISKRLLDY